MLADHPGPRHRTILDAQMVDPLLDGRPGAAWAITVIENILAATGASVLHRHRTKIYRYRANI